MKRFLLGTLYDIGLAFIPVLLGYAVGEVGRVVTARRSLVLWGCLALLCALWLAFMPNTCYLITEWRHFLDHVDSRNLYQRSKTDRGLLFDINLWVLFYLFFSGAGVLAFTLAIRPVERLLRQWRLPFLLLAPFLFASLSLGVYLGLIKRFNSWDLLAHPGAIWKVVAAVPQRPMLVTSILIFALLLWALYEAMDIWVDGVVERTKRLRMGRGGAGATSGKAKK